MLANHQHLTPVTQHPSLAVTFCEFCMPEAFCEFETVRKWVLLNLCALWEKNLPSVLFVCCIIQWERSISHRRTQMNRTHSIPQRPCGRQSSQNLTATFSSNALWTLYAEGLLWARNCAQKGSVNSVCSVRDKTPHDSNWQACRGNLTFHSPPYGGGEGGGANWGWGWGHCEFCERQRVFIIETI